METDDQLVGFFFFLLLTDPESLAGFRECKRKKNQNASTQTVNDTLLQSGCAHSTAAGAGFPTRADPG